MSLRATKKQQTRELILEVARQLLDDRGFEATTMRDIAAAANLSYQTLYNYYPTKGSVVQSLLLQEVDDAFEHSVDAIAHYQGDLLATLSEIAVLRHRVIAGHDRKLWREVVIDSLRQQGELTDLYQHIDSSTQETIRALLLRARQHGELRGNVDIALLARTLYALTEFRFIEHVMNDAETEAQSLAHSAEQMQLVLGPYLEKQ